MVLVRHVILAEIFTGRSRRRFSSVLWPDLHDELALSQLIGDIWRERRALRLEENLRVGHNLTSTELPIPAEARQVSCRDPYLPAIFALTNHLPSSGISLGGGVAIQ
jgi:hypothetical protein